MFPRTVRICAIAVLSTCLAAPALTSRAEAAPVGVTVTAAAPGGASSPVARGRGLPPVALLGQFGTPVPLKDLAQIVVSPWGYRYMAGQQNSNLTITQVGERLRYVDTGTRRWRTLPRTCKRQAVPRGIAAVCRIPAKFRAGRMFLEVWPRLGNDRVDTSTLPRRYRSWVLADAGNDTVSTGAGDDFINGAQNRDVVSGGAGDDWLRSGTFADVVRGGEGHDKIVGADGNDLLYGGPGRDRVYGATGNDTIWSEEGADSVVGGSGRDLAYTQSEDRVFQVEDVRRS